MNPVSRRNFLKAIGAGAGAAFASKALPIGNALAQGAKQRATVVIYATGGLNAFFPSAHAFRNKFFSVTDSNIVDLGGGLQVDKSFYDALSQGNQQADQFLKAHFASVAVRHGSSNHEVAQQLTWAGGGKMYPLALAAAMGGTASIKAALVGGARGAPPPGSSFGGVSLQTIGDVKPIVSSVQGVATDPTELSKGPAAKAILGSQSMSSALIGENPGSLGTLKSAQQALIETLQKPAVSFALDQIPQAYGLSTTAVSFENFASTMAAAELMIRTGTSVVLAVHADKNGWDTHGDTSGARQRAMMAKVAPSVGKFIQRMMIDPATSSKYDVTIAFLGDFARSGASKSDHAQMTSGAIIGPRVKTGISGMVQLTTGADPGVAVAAGTPAYEGLWSYLAALSGVAANPFGANPHGTVIL